VTSRSPITSKPVAADVGVILEVSRPELARLPVSPGRDATSQVRAVVPPAAPIEMVFVHRDADREQPSVRKHEAAGLGHLGDVRAYGNACAAPAAAAQQVLGRGPSRWRTRVRTPGATGASCPPLHPEAGRTARRATPRPASTA